MPRAIDNPFLEFMERFKRLQVSSRCSSMVSIGGDSQLDFGRIAASLFEECLTGHSIDSSAYCENIEADLQHTMYAAHVPIATLVVSIVTKVV